MTNGKNSAGIKILTSIAFLVMVTVNALANILPIGGVGTGEVSDSYPNLFAPAAITFSIWGVIYLLLAMYTLYQIGLFHKKDAPGKGGLINRISTLFMFSSFTNTAWIFAWHYKIIWASLVLMAALFIFLMLINLELKRHELTAREKVFVRLPFSVYFGWITVASIANVTTFLVSVGWDGFGLSEVFWTVAVIAVGAIYRDSDHIVQPRLFLRAGDNLGLCGHTYKAHIRKRLCRGIYGGYNNGCSLPRACRRGGNHVHRAQKRGRRIAKIVSRAGRPERINYLYLRVLCFCAHKLIIVCKQTAI